MFAAAVPAGRLLRSNWISPVLPGALDAPKGPTGMVPRFPKFRASLAGLIYVSPEGPLELPHAAGASRAQTANTVEWTLVHRFVFVFMHNPPVKQPERGSPARGWNGTPGAKQTPSTFGLLCRPKLARLQVALGSALAPAAPLRGCCSARRGCLPGKLRLPVLTPDKWRRTE